MDKSHYIIIRPQYTLDKWKDGASGTRKENEFQELENYIPYDGGIFVREGVIGSTTAPSSDTPVVNTPGTTPTPFDPSTDTRCYIILNFEDGTALGKNTAFPRVPPQSTFLFAENIPARTGSATWSLTDYKQGSASLWITNNTAENTAAGSGPDYYGLQRPGDDTSLRTWIIGVQNSTVKEWLITGWFKITSLKTSMYIFQTGVFGTDEAITIRCNTATGGFQMWVDWYNQIHGTIKAINISGAFTINTWYFFGTWCSTSSGSTALYIYNDVTKGESYTATTGISYTNFYASTSRKTIGGYSPVGADNKADPSEAFPGKIDYITMWGELPAADADKLALIKQVRDLHKAP